MSDELIDQYVQLLYEVPPRLEPEALAAAWAAEGYQCEHHPPRPDQGEQLMTFRGETLVIISVPQPVETERLARTARALDALGGEHSQMNVSNPRAALADLERATVAVTIRTRLAKPAHQVIAANDLICTLLGIDETAPCVGAYFETSDLLVGREDLGVALSQQRSRGRGAPRTPVSVLFSLDLTREGATIVGGTKGLAFFEIPELAIRASSAEEAVAALFNAGCYALTVVPRAMGVGESLSLVTSPAGTPTRWSLSEGLWRDAQALWLERVVT